MTTEQLLHALSRDPSGIQITIYPSRVTIDLGYGSRERFEGETLQLTAFKAGVYAINQPGPTEVVEELTRLNNQVHL